MQIQLERWNMLRYCCRLYPPASLAKNGKNRVTAGNKLTQIEETKLRTEGRIVMKMTRSELNSKSE